MISNPMELYPDTGFLLRVSGINEFSLPRFDSRLKKSVLHFFRVIFSNIKKNTTTKSMKSLKHLYFIVKRLSCLISTKTKMKPTSLALASALALAGPLSSFVKAEERKDAGAPAPPYHDIQTRRVPSTPLPISIQKELTTNDGSVNYNPYEFVYYEISSEASLNSIHSSSSSTMNRRNDDGTDTIVDNNNDNGTHLPPNDVFVLPPSMQDEEKDCAKWALAGECNVNPNFMLRKCIRSCLQNMEEGEHDLLQWGIIDYDQMNYVVDENCQDKHAAAVANGEIEEGEEGCEDWALEGLCKSVEDKAFMLDRCAATCMVCIPPGYVKNLI